MKFAPVTLALVGALAAGSLSAPAFAEHGYGDNNYNNNSNYRARYDRDYREYSEWCRQQKKKGQRSGLILGAITGAVIGSQVSGNGARTEGAAVGAVAGAVVGSQIGRSAGKAKCDNNGAYWSQADTHPYRGSYDERGGQYDDNWYQRRNCRWAQDYQGEMVRVCPDRNGRYRMSY